MPIFKRTLDPQKIKCDHCGSEHEKKKTVYGFFIHIPKTGGSTISAYIKAIGCAIFLSHPDNNSNKEDYPNVLKRGYGWETSGGNLPSNSIPCSNHHWHAKMIEQYVDMNKIDFNFAMIRDPVDRLISEYRFRKKHYIKAEHSYEWQTRDPGSHEGAIQTDDFSTWLNHSYECYIHNEYVWDNHFRPQSEFIFDDTILFRFPDFQEVRTFLIDKFNRSEELSHINKSEKYEANVTKEDRQLIEKWYNKDYELLETRRKSNWYNV